LDEPTIGVDIHVRKQILALLRYLQSESGTTIFLTTHNLSDIEELCNRIILLNDGKVCYDGSKERISELSDQLGKIVFRLDKQISLSECRRINTDNYSFTVNESGELCATYPVNQPGITVKIINHVQSNFRIKSLKLEECKLENIIDEFCKTDSKPSSIQI
jgi:ABC-2 type transport system ATP-binding protein